ncbi:conserved hypothetical protein [Perkinsus marinus ATCC 50983]|uniref:DNL-type domain-containing protein n=1 Tax=Perkinsus marinus (strain ATCC 50983 / TXsc) TaxID=423536 RepID=C5KAG9_PERM5|nr:conserved hypothetical protein [Perkinsus marinus ATCC 50983]EER18505.1 conserved hypothetical protein [Perkinsus marinus ATCC 50983]|eukprot:XP_002786709.1 conserved hypothetical protein [Perkinsus marinus ATCC 50983]
MLSSPCRLLATSSSSAVIPTTAIQTATRFCRALTNCGSLRGTVPLTRLPGVASKNSYKITYTCRDCSTKGAWMISKHSYHHGMVAVQCPGCGEAHLISDTLGCFAGIPRTDALRIREKLEDLISSSATIYSDVRGHREALPDIQVEGLDEHELKRLQLQIIEEMQEEQD